MTFTLAHISDIHLGPLPAVRKRDLVSKRITGYVNWRRNRARAIGNETLSTVLNGLLDTRPDHVAVTGDLTNLALDAELAAAATWLETLGDPHTVSVVPGNHDAYVRGAVVKALSVWKRWMTGDDGTAPATNHDFPYVRRCGPVAVIGVSSAVATPVFMAAGRFGGTQARRLAAALDETGRDGLFRVVLIHHPPVRGAARPSKRLVGIRRFQDVVRTAGAELVLHGHTHKAQRHWIDGPHGTRVPVIGVPAAGQAPGHERPAGAFNLFRIGGKAGNWSLGLEEWSVDAAGALALTETRDVVLPGQETSTSRK